MKRAILTAVVALALPGAAHAGLVTMVSRNVPLGSRQLQAVAPPMHFNMLGLHWQGAGVVSFRTFGVHGWSAWSAGDADSGPDNGSAEAKETAGWHDGNLDWTGASTGVQFRTTGRVSRLRAFYLWSRVSKKPMRTLALAGSPAIVPRADWEADEKIVRAKPLIAPVLKLAVVHHTAGSNDYTRAEAPAVVRGIEVYHVQANGWNDIGYNFLIDRYGTVYEGRAGGITKNVIGAHALGFNTGTVGISLIGNFSVATPPPAMVNALVKLLAWRLDIAHIDPLSRVVYTSGGNLKFPAGKVVTLDAISGHRDTGPTDCPGNAAYKLLPAIRTRVAATGLPKLYSPLVTGALGGDVRFQARLSSARSWTVAVTDATGHVVAQHKGTSAIVDWTWPSAGSGRGPFAWSIASGTSLLAATGTIGGKLTPVPAPVTPPTPVTTPALLTGVNATPTVLTPSTNGSGFVVSLDLTLARNALLTVTAGSEQLFSATAAAGNDHFEWDLSSLADGRYPLVVTATANGQTATQTLNVALDRTLSGLMATPATFSPNGDGSQDTIAFGFTLARAAPVQVAVQRNGAVIATLFSGQLAAGYQSISWDGGASGARFPDGEYTAVVTATGPYASVSLLTAFAIDTVAPSLALVDPTSLQLQLTKPATVSGTIDGQPVSAVEPAGTFTFPWTGPAVTSYSLQAKDAAGNLSAVVSGPTQT